MREVSKSVITITGSVSKVKVSICYDLRTYYVSFFVSGGYGRSLFSGCLVPLPNKFVQV